jgi:hypothetical protein
LIESIELNQRVGSRDTAFFGNVGYSYGKVNHKSKPFPRLPIFDMIFHDISQKDPSFTRDNFTCLVNYYRDGNSFIAQHSDNELNIKEGSTIYTVSLGETRRIEFLSLTGAVSTQHHDLEHGSIFEMSAESQAHWVHSIDREPHRPKPRLSFTFRQLEPVPESPTPVAVPHIKEPKNRDIAHDLLTPTEQGKEFKRVLLLTDSMISNCPPHIFNEIGPYRCIKKFNKCISDLDGFGPEFKHSDFVILGGGINDISRYNWTAESLADHICPIIARHAKRHPKTNFIINALLWTTNRSGRGWLNAHVDRYNSYMHMFSRNHPNVHFYDAHEVLRLNNSRLHYKIMATDSNTDRVNANGIHITLPAQRIMTAELVNFVGYLHARANNLYTSKYYNRGPYIRDEFR